MSRKSKQWTTKDGTKIRICDMDDDHLINAIKLLEKGASIEKQKIIKNGTRMLSTLRGEMAIESVENGISELYFNELDPSEFYPIYNNLIIDAKRHKLMY